jgi:FkbM family methyltransferase
MKAVEFWDKEESGKHCQRQAEIIIEYFLERNINTVSYLDIGANVGKIFDIISKKLNVKKCVLYEASPILAKYMEEKFKEFSNVVVRNCAVSNFNGYTNINQENINLALQTDDYTYTYNLGVSTIGDRGIDSISVKAIKDIMEEDYNFYSKIDFIKIDTETVDYFILENMISFISSLETKPLIVFEHNYMFAEPEISKNNAKNIYETFIKSLGYEGLAFEDLHGDAILYPPKKTNLDISSSRKTKIRIHNPGNDITKYYRYYNVFWDKLTEKLKQIFDVEENTWFSNAHFERYNIQLIKGNSGHLPLLECEYIIENLENGEFIVLSASDGLTHAILNEKENPYLKKVLASQFLPRELLAHVGNKMYKYSPWLYFKSSIVDIEPYYQKRLLQNNFIDKMYFRGTSLEDREILHYIDKNLITDFTPLSQERYYDDIIQYKLALSIDGRAEFCYRDIECLGLGIPMIRFEYESKFYEELIPNYHYVSISRPNDMTIYRKGNDSHAKLLESRFLQVVNDQEFLNFIAKNGREYYEKNCLLDKMINKTLVLSNIQNWL